MPPTQTYPNASTSDSVMVSVVNSSGCRDTVKKYFPIYPLPTTNAGIDTAVCVGGSVTLTATGANTYVWAEPDNSLSCTNCPDPIATPVATVTYVLTGSTAFGCTSSDSVTVKVITPGTISLSSAIDSICIGQHVQLIASGEAIYNWTPATGLNNPNISNPIASPDSTTTYQIVGADYKACFADTQYVQVVVFNYPTIDAGPPVVTIAPGSTYQINATGSPDITTVTWTPSAGLSCTNCYDPVAKPTFTTTYTINATNNGGCSVSDSIELIVLCGASNLFVPNTFSPNGDGVNDIFYVRGKALSRIQSMLIFNRWGQVVFEKKDFAANDPTAGWDGTFNGKPAPIDVYIYEIEVICDNSQVLPYHGNVALIR
jgi:gliding motility-associated-like protein